MTTKAGAKIREAASLLDDDRIMASLVGIDMISKKVMYHHSCRKEYLNKAQATKQRQANENQGHSNSYVVAFTLLKEHIQSSLVDSEGAEHLTSLHNQYMKFLGIEGSTYSAQCLCDKIKSAYPNDLKMCKTSNKLGIIVYNSSLCSDVVIQRAPFDGSFVKEAAFFLRARLLEMQKEVKISNGPMTREDIIRGQGESPKELLEFFTILYSGKTAATESQRTKRLVKSVCDDIVYATSQGHVKPSKHLCLGLSIKSLTGSRKVLEVLNRFGHCISYHTVESIETDLATNISQRNYATPEGIVQKQGLCTGLAWDN